MIKLKDILIEGNIIKLKQMEAVPDHTPMFKAPYNAHELSPPSQHAYGEPAGYKGDKGMEPYVSKQDFTGMSTAKKFEITDDFIKYIKTVENGVKKGFSNGKWTPYFTVESVKRGNDVYQTLRDPKDGRLKSLEIAYGHKIKRIEDIKKLQSGLTEMEATNLLKSDLMDAQKKVELYLKKNRLPTNLSQTQWEMLIDYAFNLGSLNSFPEMTKAIVFQDIPKAKREYKRYGNIQGAMRELGRNIEFFKRYLTKSFT